MPGKEIEADLSFLQTKLYNDNSDLFKETDLEPKKDIRLGIEIKIDL
jgi:hypothetical protein